MNSQGVFPSGAARTLTRSSGYQRLGAVRGGAGNKPIDSLLKYVMVNFLPPGRFNRRTGGTH